MIYFFTLSDYRSFFFRNRRRNRFPGNLIHRPKAGGANFKASAAFYAFVLVNYMDLILGTCNRLYGASLTANHTGLALIRINIAQGYFTKYLVYLATGKRFGYSVTRCLFL
jgi:hypothetical protein